MSETEPFFPHGMPTLPGHDPTKVRRAPIVPSAAGMRATANEDDHADTEISRAEEFHGIDGGTASVWHFRGNVIIGCTYGIEPIDACLDPAGAREFAAAIVRAADAAEARPSPDSTPWPPRGLRLWTVIHQEAQEITSETDFLACTADPKLLPLIVDAKAAYHAIRAHILRDTVVPRRSFTVRGTQYSVPSDWGGGA
jgi:hypothetical protein